jgi:hypothetical protein
MPKTLNGEKGSKRAETAKGSRGADAEKGSKKTGKTKGSTKAETAKGSKGAETARRTKRPDTEKEARRLEPVVPRALSDVKKHIVSKFPEMKGVRPSVVKRKVPVDVGIVDMIEKIDGELGATLAKMKSTPPKREIYCASFEKKIKTSSGSVLQKIVRVTFDKEGHILKLVSSK